MRRRHGVTSMKLIILRHEGGPTIEVLDLAHDTVEDVYSIDDEHWYESIEELVSENYGLDHVNYQTVLGDDGVLINIM